MAALIQAACCAGAWSQPVAMPPVTAAGTEGNKLEAVRVEAARQPYRSLFVTGAMKTDTPIRDLAQSVRVLSADMLADAGVTQLADALELGSGIARQSNFGGLWDSYAMRGFTGDPNFGSDYMVNGFNYSRGYNGLRDTAATAMIELLKGPASALYGRGEPGGTVNIVTKKPLFQPGHALEVSGGSFGRLRSTADLTGPFSERLAYRLNAASEKGDSYRDHVRSERHMVAASLLWRAGDATTVSYELEHARQRANFDRGIVAIRGELGRLPRSRFLGEPADGPHATETTGHQIFIQHDFNDDWAIQAGFSHRDSSINGISTEARFLLADDRSLVRQRRSRDNSALDMSGRFELLGRLRVGGLVHRLLVGADAYRFIDHRKQYRVAEASVIDIYEPVYGQVAPPMPLTTWTREAQRSRSVYGQDQIDLSPQWKMLLGVRHDSYDQSLLNRRNGITIAQSLSATTPRVGLVYQPSKTLSLYASASRSFRPNSGVSRAFQSFPAEAGRAGELGIKFDTADGKTSSTLAIYRIAKNNVLTPDPLDPNNFSVAAGEVRSRGLEFDISGEVLPGLRLTAAYAWTDAQVTRDSNAFLVGRRLANVPRQSANLMLVQAFLLGANSATLGAGINHVGEREGAVAPLVAADNFKLPGYTTLKLIGSLQLGKQWRASVDIDNLLDRLYYSSSYMQAWVLPGGGRSYMLSARYQF
ncbi:TonB-dependent siderophore receptor [Pelomonas sp. Root1237]|uniref:TonB-dependent siderophore receptor n=1 Tax=Pelomonas sp. Root1237 TaxID=1736434 RepID=UPI0009ECB1C0|nr:TonB-dependent siderophore receptor [Pelomonas sp. Root1237]